MNSNKWMVKKIDEEIKNEIKKNENEIKDK